jgi:WD40-like Beta Propeller Repeat
MDVLGAPAWSPNGRWVVAGAIRGEQPNLVKFPVGGGAPEVLVENYAVDPAWSPSGDFIVYTGADIGTNFNLYAVNEDGSARTIPPIPLTRGARRLAFLNEDELVFLKGNVSYRDFWRANLRTGEVRELSKLGPEFEVQDFDISANGRSIIFDRRQEESNIVLIERRVR